MSTIPIDDIDVIFPFPKIYPEQRDFMGQVKLSLDSQGQFILEMPSGTGKTVALFSILLSYLEHHPEVGPFVYCCRSIPAMDRAINDLRLVHDARVNLGNSHWTQNFRSLPFFPQSAACINPDVFASENPCIQCAQETMSWSNPKCSYCPDFDNIEDVSFPPIPKGIPNLQELKDDARERNYCPYFLPRCLLQQTFASMSVMICSYDDILDPKNERLFRSNLPDTAIIIFDDAETIDQDCCNLLSYNVHHRDIKEMMEYVQKSLRTVAQHSLESETDELQKHLDELRQGIRIADAFSPYNTSIFDHPVPSTERSLRPIPGSLRHENIFLARLFNFLSFLNSLLDYKEIDVSQRPPEFWQDFLTQIYQNVNIEPEMLHFFIVRFALFVKHHQLADLIPAAKLLNILNFAAVASQYGQQITVVPETRNPNSDLSADQCRYLQLACLDAKIVWSQISRFHHIGLIGETMSTLAIYQQLLGIEPTAIINMPFVQAYDNLLPMIITRGTDQSRLMSKADITTDLSVIRNYGSLLEELSKIVPDGIIVYFPSIKFMHKMVIMWKESDMLRTMFESKLVFFEQEDEKNTILSLDGFRHAVNNGRGAMLFCIFGGRMAQAVDLTGQYSRCVVALGYPDQLVKSNAVMMRAKYLDVHDNIAKDEFNAFNSMRYASLVASHTLASKKDNACFLFVDILYSKQNIFAKLPPWLRNVVRKENVNQSIDEAIEQVKKFLLKVAQPFNQLPGAIE